MQMQGIIEACGKPLTPKKQLSNTDINPQQNSVNRPGVGTGLSREKDGSQRLKAHLHSAKTFPA